VSPDWETNLGQWDNITRLLVDGHEGVRYGNFMGILHADGTATDYFDMEVGRILQSETHPPLTTRDGQPFIVRDIPPYMMATYIQKGTPYEMHIGFSTIGEWAEMNDYAFVGPMHGVILDPRGMQDADDLLVEVQFPVQKRDVPFDLLDSDNSTP
jgi:hypothetical protein